MAGEDGPTRVDVNVLEASLCFTEVGSVAAAAAPEIRSIRNGVNRYPPTYPSSIYPTADGYAGVTALTPAQWTALCGLIERPELASAARFRTSLERVGGADEIDSVLAPLFAQRPTDYWVQAGDRLRIPITPAPRPSELPGLAHWAGRGAFAPLADRRGVSVPTLPFHFRFDGEISPRPSGGPRGPLTGVRVADFSMGWAGPLAARYLADLGADVLKIESRTRPDWWRGWEVLEAQDPPLHESCRSASCRSTGPSGGLDLATWQTTQQGKAAAEANHPPLRPGHREPGPGGDGPAGPRASRSAPAETRRRLHRHAAVWAKRAAIGAAGLWIDGRASLGDAFRQRPHRLGAQHAACGLWRSGGRPLRGGGGADRLSMAAAR